MNLAIFLLHYCQFIKRIQFQFLNNKVKVNVYPKIKLEVILVFSSVPCYSYICLDKVWTVLNISITLLFPRNLHLLIYNVHEPSEVYFNL